MLPCPEVQAPPERRPCGGCDELICDVDLSQLGQVQIKEVPFRSARESWQLKVGNVASPCAFCDPLKLSCPYLSSQTLDYGFFFTDFPSLLFYTKYLWTLPFVKLSVWPQLFCVYDFFFFFCVYCIPNILFSAHYPTCFTQSILYLYTILSFFLPLFTISHWLVCFF